MKRALLSLLLFALAACAEIDVNEELAGQETNRWLTAVPDRTLLTRMSIPGAHDAASATITSLTLFTRTQELNVSQLWNCGIRAFDLRPAFLDGTLGIYHDRYWAHISFQTVMNMLINALDRDPGEFAIVLVRHEIEADGDDPDWPSKMGEYLGAVKDRLIAYRPNLTVGDMRGKILLLSRNEYDGGPYGGYIKGWYSGIETARQQGVTITSPTGETFPLWLQDYYDPKNVDAKWDEVRKMLDATADAGQPYPLVINHASGYTGGSIPDYRNNARGINSRMAEYVRASSAPAGIVMMDYAGVSRSRGTAVSGDVLVKALIEKNHP